MLQVNVQGGTAAGIKRVFMAAADWVCDQCQSRNKYYWLKCPNCNARRPT